VVFVDHAAEYAVASDQAVNWQGGWPVLVVGCMVVESLMLSLRNTVSTLVVNMASLSRIRKRNELISIAQTHSQMTSGLSNPLPRRIGGHSQICTRRVRTSITNST
jgi:hypothetical protein